MSIPQRHQPSSPSNRILLQPILPALQPLERPLPIPSQLGLPQRRHRRREEPRPPVIALVLALGGFLALPLFELLLDFCGLGVLLGEDSGGDGGPEAAGFVGELGGGWGDDFGDGEEGFEVD